MWYLLSSAPNTLVHIRHRYLPWLIKQWASTKSTLNRSCKQQRMLTGHHRKLWNCYRESSHYLRVYTRFSTENCLPKEIALTRYKAPPWPSWKNLRHPSVARVIRGTLKQLHLDKGARVISLRQPRVRISFWSQQGDCQEILMQKAQLTRLRTLSTYRCLAWNKNKWSYHHLSSVSLVISSVIWERQPPSQQFQTRE